MLAQLSANARTHRSVRHAAQTRSVRSRAPLRALRHSSDTRVHGAGSVRRPNLSLVGPPGSGKGSYGTHFARALNVPLVAVSDLLRARRPELAASLSDGTLVDDAVVGETVLRGLLELRSGGAASGHADTADADGEEHPGYILDGFPRTLRQVALMEATWPAALRVASVVHLRVPDAACRAKLLGRRTCSRCGTPYNVNGVEHGEWQLPPVLPPAGHVCVATTAMASGAACDWSARRDDDTPEIVEERLKIYHRHADPILEHFENAEHSGGSSGGDGAYRVLTLTPYRGFEDLPVLIQKLHAHVGRS